MSLNSMSSHEVPQEVPTGFSFVSELNKAYQTHQPTTAAEYKEKGLLQPEPGEYAQNNGTIALVDQSGNIQVMLPTKDMENAKAKHAKALADLDSLGYIESNFMVPTF